MARRIDDGDVAQAQLALGRQLVQLLGPRDSIGVLAHMKARLSVDDIWTLMLDGESPNDSAMTEDAEVHDDAVTSIAAAADATPRAAGAPDAPLLHETSVIRKWYHVGENYWVEAPKTLDGVLGGLSEVHSDDIVQSRSFLRHVQSKFSVGATCALDVGAGIGRVTASLLAHHFSVVDLLEQDAGMLHVARTSLMCSATGDSGETAGASGVARDFFCCGMQDFEWPPGVTYDVVWLQWVVGCVLDVHLVAFLRNAAGALRENGCIIVKDNHSREPDAFWYDIEDNSIARSRAYFEKLVGMAGLMVLDAVEERDWDDELLPVTTYALRPRPSPAEVFRRNKAAAQAEGTMA